MLEEVTLLSDPRACPKHTGPTWVKTPEQSPNFIFSSKNKITEKDGNHRPDFSLLTLTVVCLGTVLQVTRSVFLSPVGPTLPRSAQGAQLPLALALCLLGTPRRHPSWCI